MVEPPPRRDEGIETVCEALWAIDQGVVFTARVDHRDAAQTLEDRARALAYVDEMPSHFNHRAGRRSTLQPHGYELFT